VTGDKKGLAITVSTSQEFSIWQDSSVPRMRQGGQAQVRLGNPGVVTSAGLKFMQSVFQLGVGDVDAVLNDDVSVCYVVKLVSRAMPIGKRSRMRAFKPTPAR
jgi:hypothetical protein